jgi:hypothetical protein
VIPYDCEHRRFVEGRSRTAPTHEGNEPALQKFVCGARRTYRLVDRDELRAVLGAVPSSPQPGGQGRAPLRFGCPKPRGAVRLG